MPTYRVGWIGTEYCRSIMNNVVVELKRVFDIDIVTAKSPHHNDPLFGPQDAHMVYFHRHWGQRADVNGGGLIPMDEARAMIKQENKLFVVTCLPPSSLNDLIQISRKWKSAKGDVTTLGDIVDPEFVYGETKYHPDFKQLVEQHDPKTCIRWICLAIKEAIEKNPNLAVARIQHQIDIYWAGFNSEYREYPINLFPMIDETLWALQGFGIQCKRVDHDPTINTKSGFAVHCFLHSTNKSLEKQQSVHPVVDIPTLMVPLVSQGFKLTRGEKDSTPPPDSIRYYWMPMAMHEYFRDRGMKELLSFADTVKGLVTTIVKLVTGTRGFSAGTQNNKTTETFRPVEVKEPFIDLRFFVDDITDIRQTTDMINTLLGGKATAYALRDDVIQKKNISFPRRPRVIWITNRKL